MPTITRFQFRRDTAANWALTNPVLAAGEAGFETDTGRLKIGDGVTAYNSLNFAGGESRAVSWMKWGND